MLAINNKRATLSDRVGQCHPYLARSGYSDCKSQWCAVSLNLFSLFVCLALCTSAAAQTYPTKVVRYIVPGSPGAGTDLLGRIVAGGLTSRFGQQVIVENRAGAGGNIGAEMAARAPADGYTLLQISLPNQTTFHILIARSRCRIPMASAVW